MTKSEQCVLVLVNVSGTFWVDGQCPSSDTSSTYSRTNWSKSACNNMMEKSVELGAVIKQWGYKDIILTVLKFYIADAVSVFGTCVLKLDDEGHVVVWK